MRDGRAFKQFETVALDVNSVPSRVAQCRAWTARKGGSPQGDMGLCRFLSELRRTLPFST